MRKKVVSGAFPSHQLPDGEAPLPATQHLATLVYLVRREKVMLDADLVALYGVEPTWVACSYNPDWAVVLEDDARVYFVAETKSTTVRTNRRPAENLKIDCAREHFGLVNDLEFKDVAKLSELMS